MTEAPKARDKDVRPKALEHRINSQTKTAPNNHHWPAKTKRRRKEKSHSRGKKASLKTQESSGFIRTGPFALQLQHMSSLTTSPKAIVQMVRYDESRDSGIGKMAIHHW